MPIYVLVYRNYEKIEAASKLDFLSQILNAVTHTHTFRHSLEAGFNLLALCPHIRSTCLSRCCCGCCCCCCCCCCCMLVRSFVRCSLVRLCSFNRWVDRQKRERERRRRSNYYYYYYCSKSILCHVHRLLRAGSSCKRDRHPTCSVYKCSKEEKEERKL